MVTRELRFIVRGQQISSDPTCNFKGLVAGSEGFLKAKFVFDATWDGCKAFARFWAGAKEHAVPIKGSCCMVPKEVLVSKQVGVSVAGVRDGFRIDTSKTFFTQEVM